MRRPVYLYGRNGFGDAIYTRAVARVLARAQPTVVATAWPELFSDLPVEMARPSTRLHGPSANMARQVTSLWAPRPTASEARLIRYDWQALRTHGILAQMERKARTRLEPFQFDLPPLPARSIPGPWPVALVRPVTVRQDWRNPARNPDPVYVARAAELLIAAGYRVVSVANLTPGMEEPLGTLPPAHERYDHGELGVLPLLALVAAAALVVGGPGWVMPACLATATPLVVIGGGQGCCNGPQALVDPRMDSSRIRWLLPEPRCACASPGHNCPKVIPQFNEQFQRALQSVGALREAA